MRAYIIGYGSIGKRHHKILKKIYTDISVDIYDPFLGYNKRPEGTYDIGLVCSPTASHIQDALFIKDHCRLLFVEKPLHTSTQKIKENFQKFVNEKVHVGCNIRYTNAIKKLGSIKDKIRLLTVFSMSNLLEWRNDPNKSSYSFHREMGGGVLLDFVHEPDYVYSVFGMPSDVKVLQGRLHNDVTVSSDDTCTMIWKYDKCFVNFVMSYSSKEYVRRFEALMEDGTSCSVEITKEDIENSYIEQWKDVLSNGPKNTYFDCLNLYEKMLGNF